MGIRVSSGIKGLDKLIEGGFEVGSVALVSGGPGTGKTTFCLQFLIDGVKKGENGLYISFEETAEDLARDAKNFGWDIIPLIKSKKLIILHFSPFEYDKFKEDFGSIIKKYDIKRIAIDSITGVGYYLKDIYDVRKNVWELNKVIKEKGCTAIMTSEVISEESNSRFGVEEFIADALIVLHYGGLGGDFDRSLQVIKIRRTNQKKGIFPYKITKTGISIGSTQA